MYGRFESNCRKFCGVRVIPGCGPFRTHCPVMHKTTCSRFIIIAGRVAHAHPHERVFSYCTNSHAPSLYIRRCLDLQFRLLLLEATIYDLDGVWIDGILVLTRSDEVERDHTTVHNLLSLALVTGTCG
jgi:hypothetical protein